MGACQGEQASCVASHLENSCIRLESVRAKPRLTRRRKRTLVPVQPREFLFTVHVVAIGPSDVDGHGGGMTEQRMARVAAIDVGR